MIVYYDMYACTGLPHGQEIRKSQEKLKKMTKVRKSQVKMGFFVKSQKIFF